jgi:5-methylcytosine-specific restriction endonuclease McrA
MSWQRATTLVILEKAEVLASYETTVRSQYLEIPLPAVIRLLDKIALFSPRVKFNKLYLFTRDQWRCQYCGQVFRPKELTYDHVVPQSRGGRRSWTNIVTACVPCNQKKGDRTPREAGLRLLKIPKRPRWMPSLLVKSMDAGDVPPQWEPFTSWIKK